jgi:hypothetical protein
MKKTRSKKFRDTVPLNWLWKYRSRAFTSLPAHPPTSVLWNRNDLLRFRFRLWTNFGSGSGYGSGSGSRQYLAQQTNFLQNLAFSTSEAALCPRKLAFHF